MDEEKVQPSQPEDYKVVGTKISTPMYVSFLKICKRFGINKYQALQIMVSVWVRYADDTHNLSQEIELAMALFEHMVGFKDALNIADPNVRKEIAEAVYFIADKEGKKRGVVPVMVQRPFFGNWQETYNLQKIVERFICLSMPERYKRLRRLAVDLECTSLLQLFDRLIDQHASDADVAHIRKEFEDADRSEFGIKPHEQRFKRKHHRDPDTQDLFHNTNLDDKC